MGVYTECLKTELDLTCPLTTKMLSAALSHDNAIVSRGLAHILSRIDYKRVRDSLLVAKMNPTKHHTIVLIEYVHSGMYDTIAEMERIPNTTYFIEDFLKRSDVRHVLTNLFTMYDPNMKVYTRRKMNFAAQGCDVLTKYRQLVLHIEKEDDDVSFIPTQDSFS